MLVFADTETYSECDLRACGSARYAEDPTTEIVIAQWAIDDGEPVIWDCTEHGKPAAFIALLNDPTVTVVWHNGVFDRQVLWCCWGVDLPPERCHDTMLKALAHGLPGSLDKIGQIIGLPADKAKDKRGRDLIQLFAKPRPKGHTLRRATRLTHPAEWQEFLAYGGQDIVAVREVYRRLPSWNYRAGHPEMELSWLDARINARGVAVDLELAHAAINAVAEEQQRLKDEMAALTDGAVSSPSKRDELLVHILMEHGVSLPDMRADTLRRRLDDPELPDAVRLLLAIRLEATKTSTAKYKAFVKSASSDGRVRNTLQFAGANRTGRWAGRLVQLQNMPRPDMDQADIDAGVEALKAGCAPLLFDNVMSLTANAVRGCIVAPAGRKLVVADLSNIEGRGLCYLAGEDWKVQAFRDVDAGQGHDLYKLAYARSFNIKPEDVTKPQRQVGKVQELGLGYQGGVGAFITFAAVYQMDLDAMARSVWEVADREALKEAGDMLAWTKKKKRSTFGLSDQTFTACQLLVSQWRAAHAATAALWKNMQEAVANAIREPGATFTVRQLKVRRDGAWLRIRLPSGRYLCYTQPEVNDDGQVSYMGIDQYTRQWKRIRTYGGKIVENCVQAWARDVLASSMPNVEAKGFDIVLTVHDELITEADDTEDKDAGLLAGLMSVPPTWAPDCPLAAAGFETYRYRKD
jgi:DNA polymerase